MGLESILSTADISASGLAAERLRMEIAANNIANANTTSTPEGGPFRRQQVLFSSALDAATAEGLNQSGGVIVKGVVRDPSELLRLINPGHPDADETGHVLMPNVKLPIEMVDMMTAGRAYDANLKSLEVFRRMAEQALSLMSAR